MRKWFASLAHHAREQRERGAVLVLTVSVIMVLLGMAAFAVDFGWIYYNHLEARKTAEAAALAGVVHMPLPGGQTLNSTTEPWQTAVEVGQLNGYANVTPEAMPSPNQLRVNVSDTIGTFFMAVFGYDTVSISESATAEQLPVLKMGSDESHLGSDPPAGVNDHMWVAINGERRKKGSGDPFATRCEYSTSRCSGTPNSEFRDPAYYYAVEVPVGA